MPSASAPTPLQRVTGLETSLVAQRRQISVLVCDLVGSTDLSSRLDLEDMREFITAYLRCCTDGVEQAGGFVARYTGDGLLAYFGYPVANEDDTERAVRAATLILDAVARFKTKEIDQPTVRIGIATGPTVVGDLIGTGPAQEHLVIGRTPSLAARLEAIAAPGCVVVSDATKRLASAVFDFRDLGVHSLKGFAEPERAWELLGPLPTVNRFGVRLSAVSAPLTGRDDELQTLVHAWERCVTGENALVGIVGEAGIGKSRLLYEFRRRLEGATHNWLEGGSAQVFQNTPFHSISEVVRRRLTQPPTPAVPETPPTETDCTAPAGDDDLLIIGELIGAARDQLASTLGAQLDSQRDRLVLKLIEWLEKTTAHRPTVLAIEDLHWTDPSSMDLLRRIMGTSPRLLIICTSRNALPVDWSFGRRQETIKLERLDRAAIRQIITATAGDLPERVARRLVSRAGGVPLFAEELARLMAKHDRESTMDPEIPESLADLLLGRLDQAGSARQTAQIASILGPEFGRDQLALLADVDISSLDKALANLVSAQIISERSKLEGIYGFRHALVQEAAYGALLKSQRAKLHRRAAEVIKNAFPDFGAARPEILAQHWEGAGDLSAALDAWREAGRVAADQRAFVEAEHAYRRALAILSEIAKPSAGDDGDALELQGALASVLQITHGYSSAATMEAMARAEALAERSGDLSSRLENALGAWMGASSAGDYDVATPLVTRIVSLAQISGIGLWRAVAHMAQVTSRYRIGDLAGAEHAFAEGRPYFDLAEYRARPGAVCQIYGNAGIIAWIRGDTAGAQARFDLTLTLSEHSASPYEQAFGSFMAGTQAALTGKAIEAALLAARSVELSDEHGFPQFSATGRVLVGYAQSLHGRHDDGVAQIKEGLQRMLRSESRAGSTMYLTWLAEVQMALGADKEAAQTLDTALSINPSERFYRPETLRLRAAAFSRTNDHAAAAAAYAQSMVSSRAMGAQLFLDRATEGLRNAFSQASAISTSFS